MKCRALLARRTFHPANPLEDQVDLLAEIPLASLVRKAAAAHQKDLAIPLVVHATNRLHLEEDPCQGGPSKRQAEGQHHQQVRC